MTQSTIDSELDKLIAKYDDWHECDEYHIHDETNEHEGQTPLPHDFDDDKLKVALTNLIEREVDKALTEYINHTGN